MEKNELTPEEQVIMDLYDVKGYSNEKKEKPEDSTKESE